MIIPKGYSQSPEFYKSLTNSPMPSRIQGGTTSNNVLKLDQLLQLSFTIPELTTDIAGTASYSTTERIPLDYVNTPYVDFEYRDISSVSASVSAVYDVTANYNKTGLIITIEFGGFYTGGGFGPPTYTFPEVKLYLNVFIHILENKDTL